MLIAPAATLRDGRLATGAVTSVLAGIYARQALTSLGVWDSVAGRIAGAETVRAALALVDRGEAPLGIVYATDAKADPQGAVVDVFPAHSHLPILYPMALLSSSATPEAAGFARFLASLSVAFGEQGAMGRLLTRLAVISVLLSLAALVASEMLARKAKVAGHVW